MADLRTLMDEASAAHKAHEALGHLAPDSNERLASFADVAEALDNIHGALLACPEMLDVLEAVGRLGVARAVLKAHGSAPYAQWPKEAFKAETVALSMMRRITALADALADKEVNNMEGR